MNFTITKSDLRHYTTPEIRRFSNLLNEELTARSLLSLSFDDTTKTQYCHICYGVQIQTPSGLVCSNGHGGADSVEQPELTQDQENAWVRIQAWLQTKAPFFVLKGYAGTGKSFMMKKLLSLPENWIFSAPTNKASQVLSDFLSQPTKTTYSVLGLKMTAEEDKKVLTASATLPDLGSSPVLVIDEAGMIPKFMADMLERAAHQKGWRILFVGDPAQLNPVGEDRSVVWSLAGPEHRAMLKEVRRFDNQLLSLSIKIREHLKTKDYRIKLSTDSDESGGVHVVGQYDWMRRAKALTLKDWSQTKILGWRNKTVDQYNAQIRKRLGFTSPFEVGERVLMGGPLISDGLVLAHTDEELEIKSITSRIFNLPEAVVESRVISVHDRSYSLYVPTDPELLQRILNQRAEEASKATGVGRKKAWASYWELRETFQMLRYGYAMTCHRAQGSSYKDVFVDQTDILCNPNKREAFRALYVSATRPTSNLFFQ